MQRKKSHVPMTRIQERAPKDKWMRDAGVTPSPMHERTGIVDAVELHRARKAELDQAEAKEAQSEQAVVRKSRSGDAPEVFEGINAQALERRTAAAAAEASRADKLEAENAALEEKLELTDNILSEAQDGLENARNRVRILKTDLNDAKAKNKQTQKLLDESQEDRRTEAAAFAEKIGKAQEQIKELQEQAPEAEEVEVYPNRIVVDEITNTIRKGATLILKTQVRMDEELIPITIRAPFKKMKAAVDKADTTDEE